MKAEPLESAATCRAWAFCHRVAWVFAAEFAVAVLMCIGVARGWVALPLAVAVLAAATWLGWYLARRAWLPVRALAGATRNWHDGQSDPALLGPARLARRADADLVALAGALHGFASRIADYGARERSFTRDASHELRTPLTVIRASVDMLGDDRSIGEPGRRAVRRIHRATREMESLVDVLLVLARESDPGCRAERFVVNDVLHHELETAHDLIAGMAIELRLEEPARFALHGSARAFSVLCWQLIRDACQQAGAGHVVVTVLPAAVAVSHDGSDVAARGDAPRTSFGLSVAQRISDRFAWPLELQSAAQPATTRVHFPDSLPAAA